MSLPQGTVFAGYVVDRLLGVGGMGAVYLVKHPRLPRNDALKLLRSELCDDPVYTERFHREAATVATLNHPNILPVHDRGSENGQLWISMHYVEGTDAEAAVDAYEGGMPPDRAVRIVTQVGSALDYAHRHQFLHRDVKPANVLLTTAEDGGDSEWVFLTDFGIAKAIDEQVPLTEMGSVLATFDYASPEQIAGHDLDGRSDIYSLGCLLFKLLTGSVPYPGGSPLVPANGHLQVPPPVPSSQVPSLPVGFDEVIATAMAKAPQDRFQSCAALSAAASWALSTASADASARTQTNVIPYQPWPGPTAPPSTVPHSAPGQRSPGTVPATRPWQPGTSGDGNRPFSPPGGPAGHAPGSFQPGAGGPGRPHPAHTAEQPRRSRKGYWLMAAVAVVGVVAITWVVIGKARSSDDAGGATSTSTAATSSVSAAQSASPAGTEPTTSSRSQSASVSLSPSASLASMPHAVGEVVTGHSGPVSSVAFSPDGDIIASGGHDNTVRFSDSDTHNALPEMLVGSTDKINSVAYSRDGSKIVTAGDDDAVRLWDAATGAALGDPLVGHGDNVTGAEFSPDGTIVASSSLDGTVRLWDVATGSELGDPLTGHDGFVTGVAFSPDGTTVASAGWDGTVRLWDVATRSAAGEPLTGHSGSVLSVAFSPDGTTLASGARDATVRLWDVASAQAKGAPLIGHTNGVNTLAFSPDGATLVSGSWDDDLRVWDVSSGDAVGAPLTGHSGDVFDLAFGSSDSIVASAGEDGTVRLWDVAHQS